MSQTRLWRKQHVYACHWPDNRWSAATPVITPWRRVTWYQAIVHAHGGIRENSHLSVVSQFVLSKLNYKWNFWSFFAVHLENNRISVKIIHEIDEILSSWRLWLDLIPSVRSKWETESWKALILMKVSMESTLSVHWNICFLTLRCAVGFGNLFSNSGVYTAECPVVLGPGF